MRLQSASIALAVLSPLLTYASPAAAQTETTASRPITRRGRCSFWTYSQDRPVSVWLRW